MLKNIALFSVSSKNIGPFKNLTDIAIHLNNKNTVIIILCEEIINNFYTNKLKKNNIHIFSLQMKSFFNFSAFIKLYKILKANKIDILITRLRRADFMGSIVGKNANVKIIVSNIVDDEKLHFNLYHKGIKGKVFNSIYNCSTYFTDIIIVNSKSNFNVIRGIKRYKNKNIYFVPNGIDTNYYNINESKRKNIRNNLSYKKSDFVIGYIGRIEKIKGLELLIDAFKNLKTKFNQIKLIIIGNGTFFDNIQDIIKKDSKDIMLINHTDDVPGFLSAIDLFVFPSEGEGMPNSLLEAMSVGLPVIGFEVLGVKDIIQTNYNGILVKERDSNALKEEIKKIIYSPNKGKNYGINARKFVSSNYDKSIMTKNFEQIISN